MDCKYIVKHSEGYNENKLNEKDKEFIAGMRWVLENVVENFVDNMFFGETESTIEKIKHEIVAEAIEELKDDIDHNVYEVIVSIIDGYPDEDDKSE